MCQVRAKVYEVRMGAVVERRVLIDDFERQSLDREMKAAKKVRQLAEARRRRWYFK
jgi:hypothetical protein